MGAVISHPALEQTSLSMEELRRTCDFRTIGYHYPPGRPDQVRVFRPPHPEVYNQWGDIGDRAADAIEAAANVVGFRPPKPLLRVVYNRGDHQIIAMLPDGHRLVVTTAIRTKDRISAALAWTRRQLFAETGVWFATAAADWAIT